MRMWFAFYIGLFYFSLNYSWNKKEWFENRSKDILVRNGTFCTLKQFFEINY